MKVTININDNAKFRLTREGERVISEFCAHQSSLLGMDYRWFEYHKPDANGYYQDQIWTLMQMLGPHFMMGGRGLIASNELIIES